MCILIDYEWMCISTFYVYHLFVVRPAAQWVLGEARRKAARRRVRASTAQASLASSIIAICTELLERQADRSRAAAGYAAESRVRSGASLTAPPLRILSAAFNVECELMLKKRWVSVQLTQLNQRTGYRVNKK